jgi:hypothetical protein
VRVCLDTLQIVAVTCEILVAADRRAGDDFEDNVQVECAIAAGLDAIVTRDPDGFQGSPIPAITPTQLLNTLRQPPAGAAGESQQEQPG